ncbi:MAG: ATP-dependent helicase RecQ [Frankiaceae bacterium]|jgi:ATP-dependent DNA helicase RecQ|nr:ATP-dependent helicase RecQ [Frankiaceae bacterium]
MPATADVDRLAREVFGFDGLRPGQRSAIDALIAGRDTLAVLPTGSGKSAIYQIAGLLRDGPTVIVSPLIALQRNQVAAISELGVAGVAAANSHVGITARRAAFEGLISGEVKFLFVAPEQLATPEVVRDLAAAKPTLFVVDEAHCVSAWGHDFRPDYLRLGGVIEALGHPNVLALTATASPPVREELVARLGMRDPAVVVRGFDRPNIWLDVETFTNEEAKREALVLRAAGELKPGIVYAATRKRAEELTAAIDEIGLNAGCYHAGLKAAERRRVQDAFVDDRLDVVIATTAFGMGIDKPNVRFVLHYDVPDSLDSYYQEVGRAGRDGLRSEAVLFYRQEDLGLRRFFAAGAVAVVPLTRVARLLEAVSDGPVDLRELRRVAKIAPSRLSAILGQLTHGGFVRVDPTGSLELLPDRPSVEDVVVAAQQEAEQRRTVDQSRVDMIRAYAESQGCRGRLLLSYFGEQTDDSCGHCDRCTAGVEVTVAEGPYPVNARVAHAEWGPGQILRYEEDKVVVLFDTVGYKTLSVPAVVERGLLDAG